MFNSKLLTSRQNPLWLRYFTVTLLVLGICFRFTNLERKVYWYDEAISSLRISGYTVTQVVQQVYDGRNIGVKQLQQYQQVNAEKSLTDTIYSLRQEDPQHPPLYYIMARFWVQWFGDSKVVIRSLSALISLLAFPWIYWLCQELFQSPTVGWIAIALLAVSPFHVLYSQEAREYSLWIVTILASSALLLRAMRLKTKFSWVIYAVSLILGLYTFLFSGLVAIGHGIYVFVIERGRLSKTFTAYLISLLVAIAAFAPWLRYVIERREVIQASMKWAEQNINSFTLIESWITNLSRIFLDFNLNSGNDWLYPLLPNLLLILVGYAIYFLCRQTPKQIWLFILTLIGTTALALVLPDLILGGKRSTTIRYLTPSYLGIQLAIAYLFASKISTDNLKKRQIYQVMLSLLLIFGFLSCVVASPAETWWNKQFSNANPEIARIINQTPQPLLIINSQNSGSVGQILSFSHLLESKVCLQLTMQPSKPKISTSFSDVFLYEPSKSWLNEITTKQNYKIQRFNKPLYKIQK